VKFLIATTNPGKAKEFREMLGSDRFEWISLGDLPKLADIEETGHTFRANAVLKASGYAIATGLWTMADDSGLEVDALDKKPGIFSARWAKMHHAGEGDAANNTLLLQQLKDVPDEKRTARFVCVLAVADPAGRIQFTTRATMEGRIGLAPVGGHGFGYDPLFKVAGTELTSAELPPAEKHRISHRGQALEKMKQLLGKFEFPAVEA
jgi:XTP/dITP diphosphohydrolase